MIISIVTFKLPQRLTVAQAADIFKSTAPRYLGKPGLIRKHYYVSEQGDRAGGIYLWKSKADAEACYSAEWKAAVAEKYGATPEILYVNAPVSIDNLKQAIETD